jgi:hypothetical protein
MVIFESEDAANAARERMPPTPEWVSVESVEVRELVASA